MVEEDSLLKIFINIDNPRNMLNTFLYDYNSETLGFTQSSTG